MWRRRPNDSPMPTMRPRTWPRSGTTALSLLASSHANPHRGLRRHENAPGDRLVLPVWFPGTDGTDGRVRHRGPDAVRLFGRDGGAQAHGLGPGAISRGRGPVARTPGPVAGSPPPAADDPRRRQPKAARHSNRAGSAAMASLLPGSLVVRIPDGGAALADRRRAEFDRSEERRVGKEHGG